MAGLRMAGRPRAIGLRALGRLALLGVLAVHTCLRASGVRIELASGEHRLQFRRVVLKPDQAWLDASSGSGIDLLGLGATGGKGE